MKEKRKHSPTQKKNPHRENTQFLMSVMRCECNSQMIIMCTATLQRLKIGKRVKAAKPGDSLTGSNMARDFVPFFLHVCVSERVLLSMRKSTKVCIFVR